MLPLLQGAPGQRWAILVLLLLGLSLAGLTDHTFPQTLRSPDGPALDLGCLLWGLYGFGGRASRLGRMWGPRAGRCRGGARLAPSGRASCPLAAARQAPRRRAVAPRLPGCSGGGGQRRGRGRGAGPAQTACLHKVTSSQRETEASGCSEGRAPSSGSGVQSRPIPSPFPMSTGPSPGPWGRHVNSWNFSTQRCPRSLSSINRWPSPGSRPAWVSQLTADRRGRGGRCFLRPHPAPAPPSGERDSCPWSPCYLLPLASQPHLLSFVSRVSGSLKGQQASPQRGFGFMGVLRDGSPDSMSRGVPVAVPGRPGHHRRSAPLWCSLTGRRACVESCLQPGQGPDRHSQLPSLLNSWPRVRLRRQLCLGRFRPPWAGSLPFPASGLLPWTARARPPGKPVAGIAPAP